MRKLLLILFLLVFIFCGCSTKQDDNVLTFWTLQMGDFSEYINGVISDYEKTHPDIKIEWVDVPFSEGDKRTLAAVLGNNPPDLVNLNPDFSALLAQRGALMNIPETKVEGYNKNVIESLKYNGELYSIPWYATSSVTFVNLELLNKTDLGKEDVDIKTVWQKVSKRRYRPVTQKIVSIDKPIPISYTQMNNNAEYVKKKTGAYIYTPNLVDNDSMYRILNKYGLNSPDKINSEDSVKLFTQFRNLYQNNLIPKETVSITHREAFEQYMSSKSVFFQAGANFLNMLKENAPNVYNCTEIKPQLIGAKGQYDFSLMNFVIPLKAKHRDEALDFCLFLTNSENQLKLAKKTNVIATTNRALGSSFYNDYSSLESKARSISAKQLNKVVPVVKQIRNQKELNTLINTAVQQILTDKNKSVKSILDKLAADWRVLISEE